MTEKEIFKKIIFSALKIIGLTILDFSAGFIFSFFAILMQSEKIFFVAFFFVTNWRLFAIGMLVFVLIASIYGFLKKADSYKMDTHLMSLYILVLACLPFL